MKDAKEPEDSCFDKTSCRQEALKKQTSVPGSETIKTTDEELFKSYDKKPKRDENR